MKNSIQPESNTSKQSSSKWRNTQDQWGIISRAFHWIMALYIIVMLSIGFYMVSLGDKALRGQLTGMHKSFGFIFLVLLVLRFIWRESNTIPTIPPSSFHAISKLSGPVLYLSMLVIPLSGALMSQAAGYPISVFGLFTLPTILSKNPELAKIFAEVHEISAFVLIGLIVIHTLAAFYHYYVMKDRVLIRMVTSKKD